MILLLLVLLNGLKIHGSTVHIVNEKIDSGKILGQFAFAVESNDLDVVTNNDSILDTTDNIGLSEEEFLEGISNKDEITTLPEEDQLKPEIIDETMYDDAPSFDENEDLNDLLNRVDDLLNSYSN